MGDNGEVVASWALAFGHGISIATAHLSSVLIFGIINFLPDMLQHRPTKLHLAQETQEQGYLYCVKEAQV